MSKEEIEVTTKTPDLRYWIDSKLYELNELKKKRDEILAEEQEIRSAIMTRIWSMEVRAAIEANLVKFSFED